MNIYVCIKQVPNTESKIKINAEQNGIDSSDIKWILSPYDEFAVEEAIRIKEKNPGTQITVLSVGPARVVEALRTALAMGADRGIHIETKKEEEYLDHFCVAFALSEVLKKEPKIDIIFSGKEAIDDGAAQVNQMIAECLDLPSVTVVQSIEYLGHEIKCKREIEGGSFEIVQVPLPALIAAQKGLNEPRYASIPNILNAKKKEIKVIAISDLGISQSHQKIRYKNYQLPPPKNIGKKIEGDPSAQAKELIRLLHEEAKVV